MKISSFKTSESSFIYGLVDPHTGLIRYIGKTGWGQARVRLHQTQLHKDRTYKGNWLRKLKDEGLECEVEVLEVMPKELLSEGERFWIEYAKCLGWPLTNLTDGGEGLHGHVFSEEHKAKISSANKGRKLTDEQKQKIRTAALQRDPLTRLRSNPRRGWHHSEETRGKIGLANQKKKAWSTSGRENFRAVKCKPVQHMETGTIYPSALEASRALGIGVFSIQKTASGKHGSAGGLHFRYAA